MEVKVGQVWNDLYFGEIKVIAQSDDEIVFQKIDCNFLKIKKSDSGWWNNLKLLVDVDSQLSDLEIVQKALEKTGLELRVGKDWILVCGEDNYGGDDAMEVYYKDWDSLLTWAKQTIEGAE